jgi:hypothetical protein
MNEKLKQKELARRLEQATAADPQSRLDAEASAWREGWTAWGNLLDTGNAVDKETIERLLEIPNGPGMSEVRNTPAHARHAWSQYAPVASAALAVSLLLAIAMLKFAPVVDPPPVENNPVGYDASLAWNDTLDYRMTRIEERLTVAQYDSASLGSSFDSARSQLESLSREIEQNSM